MSFLGIFPNTWLGSNLGTLLIRPAIGRARYQTKAKTAKKAKQPLVNFTRESPFCKMLPVATPAFRPNHFLKPFCAVLGVILLLHWRQSKQKYSKHISHLSTDALHFRSLLCETPVVLFCASMGKGITLTSIQNPTVDYSSCFERTAL